VEERWRRGGGEVEATACGEEVVVRRGRDKRWR